MAHTLHVKGKGSTSCRECSPRGPKAIYTEEELRQRRLVQVREWKVRKEIDDPGFFSMTGKDRRKRLKYGVGIDHFQSVLDKQGGVCAICGDAILFNGDRKDRAVVDHDHSNGVFRGLLCNCCNAGIGLFKDNPSRLKLAIIYLREYEKMIESTPKEQLVSVQEGWSGWG